MIMREFKAIIQHTRHVLTEIDPEMAWEEARRYDSQDRRPVEALPLEQFVIHPSSKRLNKLVDEFVGMMKAQ